VKKLLLILLCLPIIGFGQEWTFGGNNEDWGYSVEQTNDGGYIVAGDSDGDIYILKTDGNGVQLWSQTFGGINDDVGFSIQQTNDGGFIITGKSSLGNGDYDVCLIKTDINGIELWSQMFSLSGVDVGKSVYQTNDGGYIVTGSTHNFNGIFEVFVIKTDVSGNLQWIKNYGTGEGESIQQTTDGGYIVSGNSDEDIYILKTDTYGDTLWTNTFVEGEGNSIQETIDGGYIITGISVSNVLLIKTDSTGYEQWSQNYGGTDTDAGKSVQQTTDGGYIVCGYTYSFGNGEADVYLIKIDVNGAEQWSQTFGDNNEDYSNSVQQTIDGGYIIVGTKDANTTSVLDDIFLIKTDSQGSVTSIFNIPINPKRKLEKTIDILGKETKPKTNIPFIEIYDDGTVEKKIIIE
tara:strand:+ start:10 stop:1224 length:1215 start_codon:yes stop_codon:yes gene_type:complete